MVSWDFRYLCSRWHFGFSTVGFILRRDIPLGVALISSHGYGREGYFLAAERPTGQVTFQPIRGCPCRAPQWMLTWCSHGSMSSPFGLSKRVFWTCIHGLPQAMWNCPSPPFILTWFVSSTLLSFRGLSESHASWKLKATGGGQSVQVLKVELYGSLSQWDE